MNLGFSAFVVYPVIFVIVALAAWWLIRRYSHLLNREQNVSSAQKALRNARRISEIFRNIKVPSVVLNITGRLKFKVPVPDTLSMDDEIAELNRFAEEMAIAEEEANLLAQIAQEAVRGGEAILASRDRTQASHGVIEESKRRLYEMFGQEEPSSPDDA